MRWIMILGLICSSCAVLKAGPKEQLLAVKLEPGATDIVWATLDSKLYRCHYDAQQQAPVCQEARGYPSAPSPAVDSAQRSGAPFVDSAQRSGAPFVDPRPAR